MSEALLNAFAAGHAFRPRLGFLGTGWIGRQRLAALARSGLVEIAALSDPAPSALAEAAELVPQAHPVATLSELLNAGLDGLVIATPSALHAEQAVAALERGLAVFCQKPLGRTAAETRRVVAAAQTANQLLGVDFSYRFLNGMQRIALLVRGGDLGEVFAVRATFHNAYGPDKPWFYDPRLAGGGCLSDLGIHLVDLALWALGYPGVQDVHSRLFAQGRLLDQPADAGTVEDYATALVTLANGAALELACSWRLPAGCDAVIALEFYGTRGGAALRNLNGTFYAFTTERFHGTRREPLTAQPEDWETWSGGAALAWARRLAAGERFDPEAWRLVEVAAALDALYGR
jgi:predicted dehydrogenase